SSVETASATLSGGLYLALAGHLFLAMLASNRGWGIPPWPLFGCLVVMTLAATAASTAVRMPVLHAAGAAAASVVVLAWSTAASLPPYGLVALVAGAAASGYALVWIRIARTGRRTPAGIAAAAALFVGEATVLSAAAAGGSPPFPFVVLAHVLNLSVLLALAWSSGWNRIPVAAVVPAWLAVWQWQDRLGVAGAWIELLVLAAALYAVFVAFPLILGRRAAGDRHPHLAAVLASAMFFAGGRAAFVAGNLDWMIGVVPVAQAGVLALLVRQLLQIEPAGRRDTGRLALLAGSAMAFITVAVPLQLERQWITIGWALEGAALAWLYQRISHRGLLYAAVALLGVVFGRLVLNPGIFDYAPRGMRILNWYLYTYACAAASCLVAGWWLSRTRDRLGSGLPRASQILPAAGVVLLFVLLNIEIADYYAAGPDVAFRFGVTLSQDLTYTIGWLAFGMVLLAAGIYAASRPARIAAVALIAVTTFKCFLYDLGSLAGLYRVASFVGLAMSLALVSLALQKYVLSRPRGSQ
ncbi:MAG TPA: DUF2339 domain-containing protein, partial [Vicinamibacterales bacterium]|nr:DUF2339 domain-containing protein [Vicinamibacterales bacterium]